MLRPILDSLNKKNIILASGSPRRKEIMTALGLTFTSIPSSFEENLDKSLFDSPSEYAKETARQKAVEVFNRVKETSNPDLIVAVDTVVFLDGKIIEKPKDEEDAFFMLKSLSGKTHTVHSGVTLLRPENPCGKGEYLIYQFDEVTKVTFGSLTDEIIKMYVATKEPLYGIQSTGLGGSFVKGISGDYFNVIGFPLHRFCVEIISMFATTKT